MSLEKSGRTLCKDLSFVFSFLRQTGAEWRTLVAPMYVCRVTGVTQPGVQNAVIASLGFLRMPLGSAACERDPNSGVSFEVPAAPLGAALDCKAGGVTGPKCLTGKKLTKK